MLASDRPEEEGNSIARGAPWVCLPYPILLAPWAPIELFKTDRQDTDIWLNGAHDRYDRWPVCRTQEHDSASDGQGFEPFIMNWGPIAEDCRAASLLPKAARTSVLHVSRRNEP